MKKTLLIIALALVGCDTYVDNSCINEKGDVDLDGIISVNDASFVDKFLKGTKVLNDCQVWAADFDEDGDVDFDDAVAIWATP